jgi:glycerate kinase
MTSRRTVVVAPDSFKGTIGARDAAAALAAGWTDVRPADRVLTLPMADGGEGTLDAFEASIPGAERIPVTVEGPAGVDVRAAWLRLPDGTGVVELAGTSGIELLHGDLRPWDAGTLGFGQAIRAALDAGVSRLVLAIGSSASTDGGAGMLQALGATVTDADGRSIAAGARGLATAATVDLSGLVPLPTEGAVVLADVDSPLIGPTGAAAVFGPQKGASPDEVRVLDAALAHWARLLATDPTVPGAGAAGGAGYALLAWGASLAPGSTAVAKLVGLQDALARADLVITGEGSFDTQSARGKAPGVVLDAARAAGVPAAIVAGRLVVAPDGVRAVDLADLAGGVAAAMADPEQWLREAGRRLARLS